MSMNAIVAKLGISKGSDSVMLINAKLAA